MGLFTLLYLIRNTQRNPSNSHPLKFDNVQWSAPSTAREEADCPSPEPIPEENLMPVIARSAAPAPICEPQKAKESAPSGWNFFSRQPKCPAYSIDPVPWPKRLTLSHIVGNEGKIDFSSNYSSIALLFAPDFRCGRFLPLLDLQGHRFDDTTYGATGGFILRYIPSNRSTLQEIAGLNFYYDYRQGSIGYFQQFSVGLEILADSWEVRANGYIPFGEKKKMKRCGPGDPACGAVAPANYERISYGFSAEGGGYPIKTPSVLLYLAGGPYFITGRPCKPNTVGFETKIRPQFKDFIAVDLSYSWDPLFRSIFQAEVVLYAPLYQLSKRRPAGNCASGLTLRQVYQNVERFDVMPLGRRTCRR